jgi:anti-sigma regulatory factor (Ser/Thr protein kinase)
MSTPAAFTRPPPQTFRRSLPPRLEELPAVRAELRDWLSGLGVPRPVADDIVLATWEVWTNAIEHPGEPPARDVAVEARALPRGIRVAVCNAGTWTSAMSARANRRLGPRLVEGLVDRLAIRRGLGATEVVLFRCTRKP